MTPPREASPHGARAPDNCFVAAQRAESFDTGRCPSDASNVPAGDRKAGTAHRIPDRPTSTRPHVPGAHAPLRPPTSARHVPRATVLELPESGHTDLDLAPAHYPSTPTSIPDEPLFKTRHNQARRAKSATSRNEYQPAISTDHVQMLSAPSARYRAAYRSIVFLFFPLQRQDPWNLIPNGRLS